MKPPYGPKKQTQTKPISPTPKGVKQKSDAGFQRSDICLLSSVHGPQDRNRLRLQWHFRHSYRKFRDNLLDLKVLIC